MAETPATTEHPDDASLPDGIRTVQTFRGHEGETSAVAWSPDGARIVTGGTDETVRVWDAETGRELLVLRGGGGSVRSVSWSPGGGLLASGDRDGVVRVWDAETGAVFQQLEGHTGRLRSVSWSPSGGLIASADQDGGVRVWDAETGASHRRPAARAGYVSCVSWSPSGGLYASAGRDGAVVVWDAETGKARRQLARRGKTVYSVSWAPSGGLLAAGGVGSVVRVWDTDTGTERRQLEGHTEIVQSVSWSSDGRALAAEAYDGVVVVWRTDTWDAVAQFEGPAVNAENVTTFHPTAPLLVTHGAKDDGGLRILELEMDILLGEGAAPIERSEHYVNAKVVLLGDSGVGKTALGRALMGEEFEATESTHGRHVWTLNQERVPMEPHGEETRETLLWDLAGQPAYRIIHQLSLEEVAVALVVTDARSETTPLAGVRHWARALRQARVAQGDSAPPMTQTLVVARTDRGGLSVSTQRLAAVMEELSFAGSIETSAKTNIGIEELGDAIRDAIQWDGLPHVTSTVVFRRIQDFLVKEKEAGRVLATPDELYAKFGEAEDLRAEFDACIGRVEGRGLIRRLGFGGFVLLQPEYIDAYASALVIAAQDEPDGMGHIREEDALAGRFRMPDDERLPDRAQEAALLAATVEGLLRHEIALREPTDEGVYLVFPSQFKREHPDIPDIPGRAVTFRFEGAPLSVYATLAVRLAHGGVFSDPKMWQNTATFAHKGEGRAGIRLRELEGGQAELIVFFEGAPEALARSLFEDYVERHLRRRVIPETLTLRRALRCESCDGPVSEEQRAFAHGLGRTVLPCMFCYTDIPLDPQEEAPSDDEAEALAAMDHEADERRDDASDLMTARGEMDTDSFRDWAGADATTLAIVFTDVVGSTEMGTRRGDEEMHGVRTGHLDRLTQAVEKHGGRVVKTKGDGVIAAFHRAVEAVDFAMDAYASPGTSLTIRAGVHVGPVRIEGEDLSGNMVAYCARVEAAAEGPELWISDQVKHDIDVEAAARHKGVKWTEMRGRKLRGFRGEHTLWRLVGDGGAPDMQAASTETEGSTDESSAPDLPAYPTVFVSSTYEDLKPHRAQVKDQIARQRMLFSGMEHFGADPYNTPPDRIRAEVRAADVYVGIFGMRYGSIDEAAGLSMTELEYQEAVEADKPMLLYIAHEDSDVLLRHVEKDPDAYAKLVALKARIFRTRLAHLYRNVDDLAGQVYEDLGKLRRADPTT